MLSQNIEGKNFISTKVKHDFLIQEIFKISYIIDIEPVKISYNLDIILFTDNIFKVYVCDN